MKFTTKIVDWDDRGVIGLPAYKLLNGVTVPARAVEIHLYKLSSSEAMRLTTQAANIIFEWQQKKEAESTAVDPSPYLRNEEA